MSAIPAAPRATRTYPKLFAAYLPEARSEDGEYLVLNANGRFVHSRIWRRPDGSYGSEHGTIVEMCCSKIRGIGRDQLTIYSFRPEGYKWPSTYR